MTSANPVATLLATSPTLTLNVVLILSDPSEYHSGGMSSVLISYSPCVIPQYIS